MYTLTCGVDNLHTVQLYVQGMYVTELLDASLMNTLLLIICIDIRVYRYRKFSLSRYFQYIYVPLIASSVQLQHMDW